MTGLVSMQVQKSEIRTGEIGNQNDIFICNIDSQWTPCPYLTPHQWGLTPLGCKTVTREIKHIEWSAYHAHVCTRVRMYNQIWLCQSPSVYTYTHSCVASFQGLLSHRVQYTYNENAREEKQREVWHKFIMPQLSDVTVKLYLHHLHIIYT